MTSRGAILKPELWRLLRSEFRLDWQGIHGIPHWSRVLRHGRYLASRTKAVVGVVELFAVLHDVKREHDGFDPEHGERAAEFADWLCRRALIQLPSAEQALLFYALQHHSDGHLDADVTVQVCWDADRLDLGRVGVCPCASRLCTEPARDPAYIHAAVEWAHRSPAAAFSRAVTRTDGS